MKNQIARILLASMFLQPLLAGAASRELALKPSLDRLWTRWNELPSNYQDQKRRALVDYLALFTTTNGAAWNDQWSAFSTRMGPGFRPLYADVIEVMKVAEAYEAGFPNPEERLPGTADAIFERVPANALLFNQSDLFETTLRLRQQEGKRTDVLVLNSSRVMDSSYLEVALAGHRPALNLTPAEFTKRVCAEALQRKQKGDSEFRGLEIADGVLHAGGIQLMTALSCLMMREISTATPGQTALFLPLLPEGGSVTGFVALTNRGIFFVIAPGNSAPDRSPLSGWPDLLDQAAPQGQPLHAEMAKTIGQSIAAAVAILTAQRQNEAPGKLAGLWNARLKTVKVIDSRDIRINEKGKMVQPSAPANVALPHR